MVEVILLKDSSMMNLGAGCIQLDMCLELYALNRKDMGKLLLRIRRI